MWRYIRTNKYGNKKIEVGGMKFDSNKEYNRYRELKIMELAGEIKELETQKEFLLIPKQAGERKVTYKADFCYKTKDGELVVEDVKSEATRKDKAYIIKRKLMLYMHGIKVQEIN